MYDLYVQYYFYYNLRNKRDTPVVSLKTLKMPCDVALVGDFKG